MSCDEHQQNVSKLLDGMLDKELTPAVFTHLAGCEQCRDFFSSTVHIQRAIRAAPPVPMPERYEAIVRSIGTSHWGYGPDRAPYAAVKHPRTIYSRIGVAIQLLIAAFLLVFLFSIRLTSHGDNGQRGGQRIPVGQMSTIRLR